MGEGKVIFMFDINYNEIEEFNIIQGTSTLSIGSSLQTSELQNESDVYPVIIQPGIGSLPDLPRYIFKSNTAEEFEKKSIIIDEDLIILMAKEYYQKNKKEIEKNYLGKYIAIIDNKVVAFNDDFSELSKQVYRKYGFKTIFMTYVSKKEPIIKAPFPKVVKL